MKKKIGIFNKGENSKSINNTFVGLDVGIQDEGGDTVAHGNKPPYFSQDSTTSNWQKLGTIFAGVALVWGVFVYFSPNRIDDVVSKPVEPYSSQVQQNSPNSIQIQGDNNIVTTVPQHKPVTVYTVLGMATSSDGFWRSNVEVKLAYTEHGRLEVNPALECQLVSTEPSTVSSGGVAVGVGTIVNL